MTRTRKNTNVENTSLVIVENEEKNEEKNEEIRASRVAILAHNLSEIVNNPKSDSVSNLSAIVDAYRDARPESVDAHDLSTDLFVFSIGSVRPKMESWMDSFVSRVAQSFGCIAYVQSVSRGIGSFAICGRDSDVKIATRVANALITRTHHDAWKHVNAHRSDVACATRRETFCNARLAMIDTIAHCVATHNDVRAYASTMRATNATQSA